MRGVKPRLKMLAAFLSSEHLSKFIIDNSYILIRYCLVGSGKTPTRPLWDYPLQGLLESLLSTYIIHLDSPKMINKIVAGFGFGAGGGADGAIA